MILLAALVFALSINASLGVPARASCDPSRCGPNSSCKVDDYGYATCRCSSGFVGSSPLCAKRTTTYPSCTSSTDCPSHQACIRDVCRDSCEDACGWLAHCSTPRHYPICTCPVGYTGDPFLRCDPINPNRFKYNTRLEPSAVRRKFVESVKSPTGYNRIRFRD